MSHFTPPEYIIERKNVKEKEKRELILEALAHQLVMYLITLLDYNIISENYVIPTIYFFLYPYPPTVSMIWL